MILKSHKLTIGFAFAFLDFQSCIVVPIFMIYSVAKCENPIGLSMKLFCVVDLEVPVDLILCSSANIYDLLCGGGLCC